LTKKLRHEEIAEKIKKNILNEVYKNGKLPNERLLSEEFNVSRSTIKNAIDALVDTGLVFRKQRSGNYINLLFKRNYKDYEHQRKGPIGVTNAFAKDSKISSDILTFEVIIPNEEVKEILLLDEDEFVYHIRRIRYVDEDPISVETAYIPIKILPELNKKIISKSIYQYAEKKLGIALLNSYISIYSDLSNEDDQSALNLKKNEPVSVVEEIIFTDTGIPFEYTIVRNHYKKFSYNTTSSSIHR
jgi:DNA-binding GntR family transcriptional regulator